MRRKKQSEHNQLVADTVLYLQVLNHTQIKADLSDYERPTKIIWTKTGVGHIPDVTSEDISLYIFEVETADSINDEHTANQWKLFSAYAKQHYAKFIVVVPEGSKPNAWDRVHALNITVDDIWDI